MDVAAEDLALAVARLNRRLRQERRSELTPNQLAVLGALKHTGPTTPGVLAAREKVSPPSITRTLSCLVDDGFVERVPHPDDGRQVLVNASAAGLDTLELERERRDSWLRGQLAELDESERDLLGRAALLLAKLAEA